VVWATQLRLHRKNQGSPAGRPDRCARIATDVAAPGDAVPRTPWDLSLCGCFSRMGAVVACTERGSRWPGGHARSSNGLCRCALSCSAATKEQQRLLRLTEARHQGAGVAVVGIASHARTVPGGVGQRRGYRPRDPTDRSGPRRTMPLPAGSGDRSGQPGSKAAQGGTRLRKQRQFAGRARLGILWVAKTHPAARGGRQHPVRKGRYSVGRESDVNRAIRRRDGLTVLPTWTQAPDCQNWSGVSRDQAARRS